MNTKLRVPSWLTIGLSVVAGILSVLNVTTFGFAAPWQTVVTLALAALAALGISAATGPKLETILHLTHPASLAIAAVLSTLAVTITTLSINTTVKGILTGVVTVAAGVLCGPGPASVPVPAPPVAT